MKRNLIMHVYPLACHQNWRRSIMHLRARWEQFDGRRIVAVAFDTKTCTMDEVREAFGPCEVEMFGVMNSELQEVQSFPRLLEMVAAEPGLTLYCHSKGCTHCDPTSASHIWLDAMAEACLDYPQLVDCALTDHDVCGAFRSRQVIGSIHASPPYHFAGTWYWFRNAALFDNENWRTVDPVLWGAESYPGWRFPIERSACVFADHAHTFHLYDQQWWERVITPGRTNWRRAIERAGLRPLVPAGFSPPTFGDSDQNRMIQPALAVV